MAFELDPARNALIIQDLQNDVIMEGGAFADSGAPELKLNAPLFEGVSTTPTSRRSSRGAAWTRS